MQAAFWTIEGRDLVDRRLCKSTRLGRNVNDVWCVLMNVTRRVVRPFLLFPPENVHIVRGQIKLW